jgi:hypothetical protein
MKRRRWYMVRGILIGAGIALLISAPSSDGRAIDVLSGAFIGLSIGLAFDLASQEQLD